MEDHDDSDTGDVEDIDMNGSIVGGSGDESPSMSAFDHDNMLILLLVVIFVNFSGDWDGVTFPVLFLEWSIVWYFWDSS